MRGAIGSLVGYKKLAYKERVSLEKRMLITSVSQIFKPTSNQHAAEATYQKCSTTTTNSVTFMASETSTTMEPQRNCEFANPANLPKARKHNGIAVKLRIC